MRKALERAAKITTVIDVADARETEFRVLLWNAYLLPVSQVIQTHANLFMVGLVLFQTRLAAVKNLVTPIAIKVERLLSIEVVHRLHLLAKAAFSKNTRLFWLLCQQFTIHLAFLKT